jgi:hypothetical protein
LIKWRLQQDEPPCGRCVWSDAAREEIDWKNLPGRRYVAAISLNTPDAD